MKDWVNGISSNSPDEEGIGSTIFLCIIIVFLFFVFLGGQHILRIHPGELNNCDECGKDWL